MESLDPAACFVDDLLDFSSDIGEDDDDDHKRRTRSSSSLLVGGHSRSLPDPPVEEELEWLNKDVFPGVETFLDYLPTSVENIPKQQSPISVLENSSHSSSSNNSNSSTTTIMSCCENFRVPSRARSKRRRRRHKDFSDIPGQPWWWWIQYRFLSVECRCLEHIGPQHYEFCCFAGCCKPAIHTTLFL
ncbi:unnamed protein product, partial [Vitis vinifera]